MQNKMFHQVVHQLALLVLNFFIKRISSFLKIWQSVSEFEAFFQSNVFSQHSEVLPCPKSTDRRLFVDIYILLTVNWNSLLSFDHLNHYY